MRALFRALTGALFLSCTASPASAAWHEAKTKHFIIFADTTPGELRSYATKLERFDQAARMARQIGDPPLTDANRLTIYLLGEVDELDRVVGSGSGVYGLYVTRAAGSFAFVAKKTGRRDGDLNSDIIFFHEYAHHLMLQNMAAALPAWLVEGFAEFFSTARITEDGSVTFGAAANHRATGVLSLNNYLTLPEMVGSKYKRLSAWQWELIYGRGWLLTHYLTFEPSRRGQLDRYVAGIQNGQSALDSAKAAFGDLKQLDRELNRYATRRQISGIVVKPEQAQLGPVSIRPMSAAEAAIMPVRMRSDYGVSRRASRQLAAQARKIAAAFPTDPFVQTTLAEAEYDARNYPAAIAAAERAMAADPANSRALIFKGRALMEIAKGNPANADWAAIRAWFTRANRIDPEDPEPLMLFYEGFVAAGARPTANAVKGLLYALAQAPQDDQLRMMAVRQLLADGRLSEAKREFAPLAFDPHAGDFRETAEKIVEAIDSGNAPAALAHLEEWQSEQKKKEG